MAIKDKKLFWKVSDSLIGLKLSKAITKGERPSFRKAAKSPRVYEAIQKAKIEQVEIDRTICREPT